MRIGIIGTSHSQGQQPYTNGMSKDKLRHYWKQKDTKFTKCLGDHLHNAMPENEFINFASSGRGTERYIGSVIQLKKQYNIDAVLMELSADRTANTYYKWEEKFTEWEKTIPVDDTMKHFNQDWYEKHGSYTGSINSLFGDPMGILEGIPSNTLTAWKDVQKILFQESASVRVCGIGHMLQTIDLCNMLGIRIIPWEFRPIHIKNLITTYDINFVDWMCEQGLQDCLCDGWHADDEAYTQGAQKYFKPIIDKFLELDELLSN